ncbi:MAG TPA: 1-(5-phosphoribosyl)-5-[(5-phosphoribosylamino)methylideneamino]imidazole-4-carboxamide isomerase [Chloroflexota bacterium]|nr:1-(5-phosphoribosyl)-5-[(5-phosphoribosylamino)methylideneamino]imidazole-4-carboxamide isomerase [Chloroflexota bacterium]
MSFVVIPAVDIQGGHCVRLVQGDYARSTVFDDDPVRAALRWQEAGAPWLHVVDLDGAASGRQPNAGAISRIVAACSLAIEVSGGIRTLDQIAALLDSGVRRVVLGTVAVEQPEVVETACARWGDQIVLGLDVRAGKVATRGWLQNTDLEATAFARQMATRGVRRIITTDVERDGTLTSPNFAGLQAFLAAVSVPVIASGGVATVEHIRRLGALGAEGVIVGRALYDGAFSYAEAMAAMAEVAAC